MASEREITTFKGHSATVRSVTYSPDGKVIASGSGDTTIKLWDVASGKEITTLKGHSGWVNSVTYAPDGKTLASGSEDNTIKLWDIVSGKEITTLQGHSGAVKCVTYAPDGETLASASGDTTINLWNNILPYEINFSQDEIINTAKRDYNLALQGLELKPILPHDTNNIYKNSARSPQWPQTHPFYWLEQAENDNSEAMVNLGIIYDRDNEAEKATYWYQKAVNTEITMLRNGLPAFQKKVA